MNNLMILNYKKELEDRFDLFSSCYHGSQPDVISALVSKMRHMCFNIGSPSSLEGFLKSVSAGKIKYWGDGDMKAGIYCRGVQLKGMSFGQMTSGRFGAVLKGHFRWNFGAYMVDRETRDYINDFWFNPFYIPKPSSNRMKDIIGTINLERSRRYRINETLQKMLGIFDEEPYADVLTFRTENHRFEYIKFNYVAETELFLCNIGNGDVTESEKVALRNMMKGKKNEKSVIRVVNFT
jgi:hypothetical protein